MSDSGQFERNHYLDAYIADHTYQIVFYEKLGYTAKP